jgi:histidinol-phosphate phosphatase family protein
MSGCDLVVPTVGRPSLRGLLAALGTAVASGGPLPGRLLLVDDRRGATEPLALARLLEGLPPALAERVRVLRGRGAGPAAARNLGWRMARAPWVAFLDDDVVPDPDWLALLAEDLRGLGPEVAGSQGRLRVPLPAERRPTDWERNVAGLERARWATADMAYRRTALAEVGGFDERFRRAYREDTDLALRVTAAGYRIVQGRRAVAHPVRPLTGLSGRLISLRLQAGNADDVLLGALHGRAWRERAGVHPGRRPRHLATTAAGLAGAAAGAALALARRSGAGRKGRAPWSLRWRRPLAFTGIVGVAGWLAGTAELAWARIAPGPRTWDEVVTMAATSVLLPPLATWHWLAGHAALPRRRRQRPAVPAAVLLDRDGTLIEDVPDNGDPARVVPRPGARRALRRLRAAGIPTAVISNQSGVGRGLLRPEQVRAVNQRVAELLGPLGPFLFCPHAPGDGCGCRKPAPGLVRAAAAALGVEARACVLIGDIGADMEAARAAGARAIMVPTAATLPEEVAAAPQVAADLDEAVGLLLEGGKRA